MKYHQMSPYLIVGQADQALAFYRKVFGATEQFRLTSPDGKVAHAELAIGFHTVMLAEEGASDGQRDPLGIGGTPVTLYLQVSDVDALIALAREAGARIEREPEDQFYGQRSAAMIDPSGHRWLISQEIEEISPQEMQRRFAALTQQG